MAACPHGRKLVVCQADRHRGPKGSAPTAIQASHDGASPSETPPTLSKGDPSMHRQANAVRWRAALCVMVVLFLSSMNGRAETRADGCGTVVLGNDAPAVPATEETVLITRLLVPRDHPLRTTSRLTMPAGAVWDAAPLDGTILLVLDSGMVCASLSEGIARIARPRQPMLGPRVLDTIGPGEGATLWAEDRLVIHGAGTLSMRNVGDGPATATIIRVAIPTPHRATMHTAPLPRDEVLSATASPEGVVTTSAATIDILSVSKLNVPEAHPVRTTARLTVPPGAQWQTVMAGDSFTLALETGSLRVGLQDGRARIARATDSILGGRTLDEIAPGEEATMWAGDRLVVHGNVALVVHGVGEMTAIATIVRVTTPH